MKKICLVISIPFVLAACNNNASKEAEMAAMKQHTIDSMKQAEAKHRHKEARENQFDAAQSTEATPATTTATPATTETQKKKKGWSNTAKGAVIGAGAGAVAGAVIDHNNRGAGAVIGGLAGAAVGAGTGAVIDHKKKQQQQQSNQ